MVDQMQKERDIRNAQLSSSRLDGIDEGLAQGLETGRKKEREEIAKRLMIRGVGLDEIQMIVPISLEELAVLQKEIEE